MGEAPRRSLRIDGGQGGFAERTVSLTDLAWVVDADEDMRTHGGLLDKERVNRLPVTRGYAEGVDAVDRHGVGDRGLIERASQAPRIMIHGPRTSMVR